jgi:5-methylcytosine-specific restriction endonuclease McrA
MTPETRAKLSLSKMGHPVSVETRAKIRATHKAIGKLPPSTKGRVQSPEEIARRIAQNTGRKRTPEQCQRISEGRKKVWADPDARARTIAALLVAGRNPQRRAEISRRMQQRLEDRGYVRGAKRKGLTSLVRKEVYEHYGAECWLCEQPIDMTIRVPLGGAFTVDHVLPVAAGGTNDMENLRPAHRRCNCRKQTRTLEAGAFRAA